MSAREHLLLGLCFAALASCTSTPAQDAREQPDAPPAVAEQGPSEAKVDEPSIATIDELARSCAGQQLRERLEALTPAELERLAGAEPASARLWAIWELGRSFADDGTLDAASVDTLTRALEAELGRPPPRWWVEQLAAAKLRDGDAEGPPYYDVGLDVGLDEHGDRRGAWQQGPGGTRVRPELAMQLSAGDGQLSYDLGVGRIVLGPLPDEPGTMIELARARGGTTIYYASFSQGSGGFRFPLRAIEADKGVRWTAEVCGPDRKLLAGHGHLTVEIVVLEPPAADARKPSASAATGIAVFTAESHGLALDLFDPQTGERTLAWSSDLWFAR